MVEVVVMQLVTDGLVNLNRVPNRTNFLENAVVACFLGGENLFEDFFNDQVVVLLVEIGVFQRFDDV